MSHFVEVKRGIHYALHMDMTVPVGQRKFDDRLKPHIAEWLTDAGMEYRVVRHMVTEDDLVLQYNVYLEFVSATHAMIFKLTWI